MSPAILPYYYVSVSKVESLREGRFHDIDQCAFLSFKARYPKGLNKRKVDSMMRPMRAKVALGLRHVELRKTEAEEKASLSQDACSACGRGEEDPQDSLSRSRMFKVSKEDTQEFFFHSNFEIKESR
ncbi:hypothetical protein HAX54_007995 [Datura stramonium]|uniref:Uncharacterized protein n=1 Tax=Datura stramonium TaxID=4076 RepID=A0ABS8TEB9_DATST|nr:hypothetical protein [Datura stramonium]